MFRRCRVRAAVLFGPHDLRVTDFPKPEMKADGVMIRVSYCGICGTDFHKFNGQSGSRPVKYPVPLGHEVSGIVEAVGPEVRQFSVGDRVTVDPNWSCGKCWYCRNGKRHLCTNSRGVVKGMAEYVCPPEENVYHIPDSLSLEAAALTEPLSCCMHGVDLLDVRLGETVAIIGFGAIGQLIFQLLKHSAAGKIIVIETAEEKRALALEMGAFLFVDPAKENVSEAIRNAGIECAEKVIECVGIPATAETALAIAGRGATVVLFGVADPDAVIRLKPYEAFSKELVIKTSYINPFTSGRAIELLDSGTVDPSKSISRIITLDEFPEEIKTRKYSRQGKVLVRIS